MSGPNLDGVEWMDLNACNAMRVGCPPVLAAPVQPSLLVLYQAWMIRRFVAVFFWSVIHSSRGKLFNYTNTNIIINNNLLRHHSIVWLFLFPHHHHFYLLYNILFLFIIINSLTSLVSALFNIGTIFPPPQVAINRSYHLSQVTVSLLS